MPEKILLDLTPAEAELFESEYGNNPELLLADAGVDLKPKPRFTLLPLIGSGITISLLLAVIVLMHQHAEDSAEAARQLNAKVNPSPEKIAAMIGNVRELSDPNLRDKAGRSHIFLACKAGRLDKAIAWHKLGCNWNTPRNAGVFSNNGRNFDRTGKFGMTHASPLMTAAIHRHWHIVEYALDNLRSEIEWDYRDLNGRGLIDVLGRAIDAGDKDPALLRCIEKFKLL